MRLASLDTIDLILQAGWLVKLVLLVLFTMSVVSWAIIAFKWRELKRAEQDSDAFLEVYHDGSLDRAYDSARQLVGSPLARIFGAVYAEASRMARFSGRPVGRSGLDDAQLSVLAREITWSAQREEIRLERGLSFLATVGSASPFIGLFGTVIGIMNAFTSIGVTGAASLATVAPAIAEALIATAVGLFAAIPATILYNVFVGKLRGVTAAIGLFSAEFEGDLRRTAQHGEAGSRKSAGS
ncbi:MAG TPA: MotA/TolQ/ExbB proton channel family protein [Myxococcota bacterium]|nr:MotA/TolQ/ExbB proton channel family protein [Myxococcota bacterium]